MSFFTRLFKKKKILIISEKNIHSVHCGSKLQVTATVACLAALLWISYSSGKYFAYQKTLSNKDSEIYQVNQTNKSLLYQVEDLHENLLRIHSYLEAFNQLDHLNKLGKEGSAKLENIEPAAGDSKKSSTSERGHKGSLSSAEPMSAAEEMKEKVAALGDIPALPKTPAKNTSASFVDMIPESGIASITPKPTAGRSKVALSQTMQETARINKELAKLDRDKTAKLNQIHSRLVGRTSELENLIAMTGLNIRKFPLPQVAVRKVPMSITMNDENGNVYSGGPFIPVERIDEEDLEEYTIINRRNFNSEIGYLVQLEKLVHSMPLSKPLRDKHYLSSTFGVRQDPIRRQWAMHYGMDFVGKDGTSAHSTAPGRVITAKRNGAYGNFVEIDHGFGITTRYGHLRAILVKKGDVVKRGQVIGLQGNTGRSTGSHLHYEVRYKNKPQDPSKFIKAGTYVF